MDANRFDSLAKSVSAVGSRTGTSSCTDSTVSGNSSNDCVAVDGGSCDGC